MSVPQYEPAGWLDKDGIYHPHQAGVVWSDFDWLPTATQLWREIAPPSDLEKVAARNALRREMERLAAIRRGQEARAAAVDADAVTPLVSPNQKDG